MNGPENLNRSMKPVMFSWNKKIWKEIVMVLNLFTNFECNLSMITITGYFSCSGIPNNITVANQIEAVQKLNKINKPQLVELYHINNSK